MREAGRLSIKRNRPRDQVLTLDEESVRASRSCGFWPVPRCRASGRFGIRDMVALEPVVFTCDIHATPSWADVHVGVKFGIPMRVFGRPLSFRVAEAPVMQPPWSRAQPMTT